MLNKSHCEICNQTYLDCNCDIHDLECGCESCKELSFSEYLNEMDCKAKELSYNL